MTATAGTHNDAQIYAFVGKSGSGKGLGMKQEIIAPWDGPILVWSAIEESDNYVKVIGGVLCKTIEQVVAAIQRGEKRIVLDAGNIAPIGKNVKLNNAQVKAIKAAFDRFCRIAWHLIGWMIVIEELSQVTQASWAPPAWKKLSTAGRHRGLTLVGSCQNPAQVDKDFFGNCTVLRCYKIGQMSHAKVMADVLFCKKEEILKLEKYHYIERDVDNNINRLGVVKVPKRRAA